MKTIFNFIKKNRNIILLIISFVFLTMLILGMTYAYFDLKTGGETESTMNIGGAEISATYSFSNSINITDAMPSDDILSYKDITLTYKNTSSEKYKVYLKAVIDYSTFTNTENDGVLYYDIYSGTDHSTLVQDKTIFPTITYGKAILKEISIPANSNGTLNYRINFYFPESDKLQNPDGQLVLNASISVESDNSLKYTPTLLKKIDLMYQYESETNGLEKDDTPDKNIRYVGASPKNYINFNNETWRIIGAFNNVTTIDEQGKEKKESLVKIIRNDSLGNYSWDSSESSINYGYRVNEWSQADLMTELNTDYINPNPTSDTTTWYNSSGKNGIYDYSNNIKSGFIEKIANISWNLGGYTNYQSPVKSYYNAERGTTHISNPSDGVPRTDYWNGKIGLMYPSDYGYASTDVGCRNNLYNCDKYLTNNWLFNGEHQWTLSPSSGYAISVFAVYITGDVSDSFVVSNNFGVRPVLFLKSDVLITGGTGEKDNPYLINDYERNYEYDYTGSEQTFTAPVTGTYKLETWGAQGGNGYVSFGGYGGYSVGYVKLKANSKVSVVVGASDLRNCDNTAVGSCKGGYNGGGNSYYAANELWGGGGGATHIATTNGLLSSLENNKNSILIVSGGGGGAYNMEGAHAGGFIGNNGYDRTNFATAIGGNQTSGGSGAAIGSFGQGGNCTSGNCTGGGGGYYGGGGAWGINGAGGSGYIGNSLLTDKAMYCYNCTESSEESTKTISTTCAEETPTENCAKKGNGYAKITLISAD